MYIAEQIGGDAVNGKAEGGKYFVANHGKYTEVSRETFEYSRRHVYSVWFTHLVGMLAMAIIVRDKLRRKWEQERITKNGTSDGTAGGPGAS